MSISKNREHAARITPLDRKDDARRRGPAAKFTSSLVLPELQVWDYIGNQRVKDLIAITKAMDTICEAALAILKGSPRRPQVRRVEKLAALSKDRRYQRLIRAVLTALRDGDDEGVHAARTTAVLIDTIVTEPPWYRPERLDLASYPKSEVWRPKASARRRKSTGSRKLVARGGF